MYYWCDDILRHVCGGVRKQSGKRHEAFGLNKLFFLMPKTDSNQNSHQKTTTFQNPLFSPTHRDSREDCGFATI